MNDILEHNSLDLFYEISRSPNSAIVNGDCLEVLRCMPDGCSL